MSVHDLLSDGDNAESIANTSGATTPSHSYPAVKQYVDMTTLSALEIPEGFHSQVAHEISENIQPWLLILQVQRQKKLRESSDAPVNSSLSLAGGSQCSCLCSTLLLMCFSSSAS